MKAKDIVHLIDRLHYPGVRGSDEFFCPWCGTALAMKWGKESSWCSAVCTWHGPISWRQVYSMRSGWPALNKRRYRDNVREYYGFDGRVED